MTSTPNNTEDWRERSDAGPSIQSAFRPAEIPDVGVSPNTRVLSRPKG